MSGKNKRDGDILKSFQKKYKKNNEETLILNKELNVDKSLQVDTKVNQEGETSDDKSESQVQVSSVDTI
ncbi:Hypothetical protein CINCED_3A019165 [Cinara cedri]|uniref:Uncharacterized protein n=1 Tax=Cinara cedri TaxID=506608 RepID=A0A5E4NQ29_9HEMI|nr:Hypothetical protein CINCED_3A019165 [Cinara cedri]